MSKPVTMSIVHYPIPLLCRFFWHRWALDHHTWGWDYYECKRCRGRKAVGPPSVTTLKDTRDEVDLERLDFKWVVNAPEKELIRG